MTKTQDNKNLDQRNWRNVLKIECLGVKIGIRSNNLSIFNKVKDSLQEILPVSRLENSEMKVEHWISIIKGEEKPGELTVYKDSEFVARNNSVEIIYDLIVSKIRATIAEFAPEYVFLHAGVVSWKGKGIIIPAKSCAGKTTLVLELVKRNCDYLSDEFAVIDKNGFIHPFPKKLSLRGIIDDYRQVDVGIEEFGGTVAEKAVPAGYVLVTEYKKQKRKSAIKINSSGEGVMAGVSNSISVRQNPKFVLEVLSKVADQSIILETKRGEAAEFAEFFLSFLEEFNHNEKAKTV